MNIQYTSDLHIDHNGRKVFSSQCIAGDVLVIAGDVSGQVETLANFLQSGTEEGVPILFVPGNHEFYGYPFKRYSTMLRKKLPLGVFLLDRTETVISGVRFLGCTLWTDFEGESIDVMDYCENDMPDFQFILNEYGGFISAEDQLTRHKEERQWLSERLSVPFPGPTVVVTHHAPSFRSISHQFADSPINPAFASDLEKLILKHSPELWIHGHIHESADYQVGRTRVVCNPLGYSVDGPGAAFENLKWDPGKMVRIEVSGS